VNQSKNVSVLILIFKSIFIQAYIVAYLYQMINPMNGLRKKQA